MTRVLGAALLLLAGAPALVSAQYFGQNKVQYRSFDFKIVQTEHFDVHFYERERVAALDVARMAERAYARLSRVLNHTFRERKPIILYASHSDFQQTNAVYGELGEGTGGVTDAYKQRNIFPLTGSYADIEEVLMHEMVHQFQYDIWSRGRTGNLGGLIAVNPPLWFAEGMAAYLSRGPNDPDTEMWLRDAALEGELPTIEQLTNDPRIFPYRFGQALMAFIGERWGDEAIGRLLHGSLNGGVEAAFRRTLGLTLEQLSDQWHDAIQKRFLPELTTKARARSIATAVLTEKRSDGTLHLAPALSPDGSKIAYFSEKDFYFIDLYLADASTGKVERRLVKSTFSGNYETLRFINSAASWSPDGKFLAVAAKRGPQDDLVIIDGRDGDEVRRITVDLNGITTPTWSPDGSRLVFTGYDGGLSDLFVVNADGTGLRRLTQDKFADLHPVWSPDGKTIAFATDRGPETDFNALRIGNLRIALYHLDRGAVEVLDHMDGGKNVSPQWSPDGRQIAFVSDRSGVSNVFLYDLDERQVYQLTDLFTGVQGITPLSPVLSWAPEADRLAFVYYEKSNYDIYVLDNPRSLRREPYRGPAGPAVARAEATTGSSATAAPTADTTRPAPAAADSLRAPLREGGSFYRGRSGFRAADETAGVDSTLPEPVSIATLLDSARLALPDTSEFTVKDYRVKFTPDYVARPTVGYTRDNFGRGFFGGSAIALSDILGNHSLIFAGYVNGRISEAQVLATYVNLSRRINWATGISQEPYFFLEPSEIRANDPIPGVNTLVTNVRRLVVRSAFAEAYYPFNRFRRLEAGLRVANVDDAVLQLKEPYDPVSQQFLGDATLDTDNRRGINYVQPSLAMVFDNSLMGYVGPFYGRRYRLGVGQTLGDWNFTQVTADYRRYDRLVGPFTLATRALYFGRLGRDADEFRIFLGHTELLRGNTSGSYRRNECTTTDPNTETGCRELDRLVGTQIGLASAELRFPLLNASLGFIPIGFPPIEGALFYDIGIAWDDQSTIKWRREAGDHPVRVRTPLKTLGFSIRANVLGFVILRLDYSIPQERRAIKGYWTLSLGPTF
ncbi:MAG TPA: BamA/TamA family outer membrane protein [Gemmatimonadales bacterium]|nr:BamA/TamA family outer membrane protein [Gemmatimonadales bacterium]